MEAPARMTRQSDCCSVSPPTAPLDVLSASQQTAMTTRLHLLCSASSSSVSSIAFPADEPLDTRGRESLRTLSGRLPSCDIVLSSPALRAAQTAESLVLDARAEPLLRDCDFGRWAGGPSRRSGRRRRRQSPTGWRIHTLPRSAGNLSLT